jgi:hypothetical protein
MSRELSAGVQSELDQPVFRPFFTLELLFDDDALRLWTGQGDLVSQGETWFGTGTFLQFDTIEETGDISAKGASVSLSGVPTEIISLALSEPYQGRRANIYFGVFEAPTELTQIFSGYMDQMNISEGPDTCDIALLIENKLIDLERARVARFTSAYQKTLYPNDLGLDFIEDMQDQKIAWGRKSET